MRSPLIKRERMVQVFDPEAILEIQSNIMYHSETFVFQFIGTMSDASA